MNIQFRKIHLPSPPEIKAHALIKLVEENGNSCLKSPALPNRVAESRIVSRFNLDKIIQDIENHQTNNITPLEWVHCIYNKDKWDAKNQDKSLSTSKAIWKVAEQNSWLRQKLFWNLVLSYDDTKTLALSLVKSYSAFLPQEQFDQEKLKIIQSFIKTNPAKELARLCINNNFTPYQLFQKYQLPTKTLIVEEILDNIIIEFSSLSIFNRQQFQWLLKCLKEMREKQQLHAVESLLTQLNPKLGAEHPELINWLRQHYGSTLANSRWNELSSEAKIALRKWLGAVSYQDFQRLINLILDRVRLEEHEYKRLNNRSGFWSNYSDRFERIRILLPQSSVNILSSHLNYQDVSVLLEDGSEPTEICIFDFGNYFLVEFFRGNGSETRIFEKTTETEQQLFNSQLSIKRLRYLGLNKPIHDHEYIWQYFCEQWLRQKSILPNTGIENFKGLPDRYSKYNPQTGLPIPLSENLRKRERKLQYWKQDIARLEQQAREYEN